MTVSARDKSFLRALLHHDYLASKSSLLVAQVKCLRLRPHTITYMMFDYSTPGVPLKISVGFTDALDNIWEDYVGRAAWSEGRLQLHLLKVGDGPRTRTTAILLRSATGKVLEAVERLAAEPHPMEDEVEAWDARIQDLVDMDATAMH